MNHLHFGIAKRFFLNNYNNYINIPSTLPCAEMCFVFMDNYKVCRSTQQVWPSQAGSNWLSPLDHRERDVAPW